MLTNQDIPIRIESIKNSTRAARGLACLAAIISWEQKKIGNFPHHLSGYLET